MIMCYINLLLAYYMYDCLDVDAAIAEHIGRLQQQVTDMETEVSRLQASLEETRADAERRVTAAVSAERQQLQDDFDRRIETISQQCKHADLMTCRYIIFCK